MARWRCAHTRTSPLAGTDFSELASWPSYALAAALESGLGFPAEAIGQELAERRLRCPGCREQARRNSRHWAALALAILIALLVVAAAVGSR